jgi:hypothetical protein
MSERDAKWLVRKKCTHGGAREEKGSERRSSARECCDEWNAELSPSTVLSWK